jgi:hypothetical protein
MGHKLLCRDNDATLLAEPHLEPAELGRRSTDEPELHAGELVERLLHVGEGLDLEHSDTSHDQVGEVLHPHLIRRDGFGLVFNGAPIDPLWALGRRVPSRSAGPHERSIPSSTQCRGMLDDVEQSQVSGTEEQQAALELEVRVLRRRVAELERQRHDVSTAGLAQHNGSRQ